MSGIIPEEEDDEQFMYDDVGTAPAFAPGEEIYEELPGLTTFYTNHCHSYDMMLKNQIPFSVLSTKFEMHTNASVWWYFLQMTRCLLQPSLHQKLNHHPNLLFILLLLLPILLHLEVLFLNIHTTLTNNGRWI